MNTRTHRGMAKRQTRRSAEDRSSNDRHRLTDALHSTTQTVPHSRPIELEGRPATGQLGTGRVMGALLRGMAHPKFWLGGPQCIWPHQ